MTHKQITQKIIDRSNEMLKDEKINKIYQFYKTEEDAQNWLIKSAIATLILSTDERI